MTKSVKIRTQLTTAPIDCEVLTSDLQRGAPNAGAVVTFAGHVRQEDSSNPVIALELTHYPGKTELDLEKLAEEALAKWPLDAIGIVHRIGRIPARACIVWVGIAALHRSEAYAANEFIMDALKTRIMLWKRECRAQGNRWIAASADDQARTARWQSERTV